MPRTIAIQELARTIAETCSRRTVQVPRQPTGWPAVDEALADAPWEVGLRRGVIHEWFSDTGLPPGAAAQTTGQKPGATAWLPPLSIMIHLARQVALRPSTTIPDTSPIVWIGRRSWPYPPACGAAVLERSIFVDAADLSERAWAIDVTLRCPAIGAVIADGSGLNMSATRRLQLAAGEAGVLGLLLRPPHDLRQLSAAQTRWTIAPSPSGTGRRWTLHLLRSKGLRLPEHTTWTLELNHETGALDLVPDAADRSGSPQEVAGAATA